MDETYQIYLNRVARLTLPATYQSQVQHIQESPKFKPDSAGERQAAPFPGYTVITPPWEEQSDNSDFYTSLEACQQELLKRLDADLFVPVPPSSFHITVADLIWDSAYVHASKENPEFEPQLRSQIAEIFSQYQESNPSGKPINWQLLGLMLMPRALGVCLVTKDEQSYERIINLRRAIYQNQGLMGLGIEQQYLFTAHITLGYFGHIPTEQGSDSLAKPVWESISTTLAALNDRWLVEEPPQLVVDRAELRKFDDMTRYYREPDWPVLQF